MSPTTAMPAEQFAPLGYPGAAPNKSKEITEMLLHEDLAKARIRDVTEELTTLRANGNARGARRWRRLAQWAGRRAQRLGG